MDTLNTPVTPDIPTTPVAPTPAPIQPSLTPTTPPPTTDSAGGSKNKLLITLAIILVLILATAGYFMMSTTGSPNESVDSADASPPSLSVKSNGLKGSFMEEDMNLLKFEPKDIEAFKAKEEKFIKDKVQPIKLKSGVNYLYAEKTMSFEDAINATDPRVERMAVTMYDLNSRKFLIYPKGPFDATKEVLQADIGKTKIQAGTGFVVMAEKEANMYGVKFGTEKSTVSPSFLDETKSGWQLVAVNDDSLINILKPIIKPDRIAYIFAQTKDTEFEEAKDPNYKLTYYLLWIKFSAPKAISKPPQSTVQPTQPLKQTEPKLTAAPDPTPVALAPEVSAISPSSIKRGETVDMIITGKNLDDTDTSVNDKDMTIIGSSVTTPNKIILKLQVSEKTTVSKEKKITITSKVDNTKKTTANFAVIQPDVKGDSVKETPLPPTSPANTTTVTGTDPKEVLQGELKDKSIKIVGTNLLGSVVKMEKENTGIIIKSQIASADGNAIMLTVDIPATAKTANFMILPAASSAKPITVPLNLVEKLTPSDKSEPAAITTMYGIKIGEKVLAKSTSTDKVLMHQWDVATVTGFVDSKINVMYDNKSIAAFEQSSIAVMTQPTTLVQYQKVIAKSRVVSQGTYWDAHIVSIKDSNYQYGYDDEFANGKYGNTTELHGLDYFYVPLGNPQIDQAGTGTYSAISQPASSAKSPALSSIESGTLAPGSILDGSKNTGLMAMGYKPKFWLCVTNLIDQATPFTITSDTTKLVFSDVKIEKYSSGSYGMSSYCGQGFSSGFPGSSSGDPQTAISATLTVPTDMPENTYTITLKQGITSIGSKPLIIKNPTLSP